MQVTLLNHTPEPERAIAVAARLCYAQAGAEELAESMSDEQIRKVLSTIIKSGHSSALEHASFTFAVSGVSRALTHQLVRHRIASFNQQSQRYVRMTDSHDVVVPGSVANNSCLSALFAEAVEQSFAAYDKLLEAGIPAEDARYVLPNACASKIVITMNIRELLHFFELRCCRRAQWEIRELAERMLALAMPTAEFVFCDAGAACRRGACREGAMSCGQPFSRIERP